MKDSCNLLNFLSDKGFTKTRLPSLYSDFRPLQASNPDGFEANVRTWIAALDAVLFASLVPAPGILIVKTDDKLLNSLVLPEWGKPLALGTVARAAISRGEWTPVKHFMDSSESIYHKAGLLSRLSPLNILNWGLKFVYDPAKKAEECSGQCYVVFKNVERLSDQILAKLVQTQVSSYCDHVTTRPLFLKHIHSIRPNDPSLSNQDFDVLLRFLARDKKVVQLDSSSNIIKFVDPATTSEGITQSDVAVAHIKSTLETLKTQIADLSKRIQDCSIAAKLAISKDQKLLALSSLKSRKQVEGVYASRTDTYGQLEAILIKIDEAATNKGIITAMEQGAFVLETLTKEIGGITRVDEVMERVRESIAATDEIGAAIAQSEQNIDEGEVEEEYEALLRQAAGDVVKKDAELDKEKESTKAEYTDLDDELADLFKKVEIQPSDTADRMAAKQNPMHA